MELIGVVKSARDAADEGRGRSPQGSRIAQGRQAPPTRRRSITWPGSMSGAWRALRAPWRPAQADRLEDLDRPGPEQEQVERLEAADHRDHPGEIDPVNGDRVGSASGRR